MKWLHEPDRILDAQLPGFRDRADGEANAAEIAGVIPPGVEVPGRRRLHRMSKTFIPRPGQYFLWKQPGWVDQQQEGIVWRIELTAVEREKQCLPVAAVHPLHRSRREQQDLLAPGEPAGQGVAIQWTRFALR